MKTLNLQILSPEKQFLKKSVESLTLPTQNGAITILPNHIGLFTEIEVGELIYQKNASRNSVVVDHGFANITPDNQVLVMVDSAFSSREISLEKAKKAVEQAQKTIALTTNQQELILAEASLRLAMIEIKIAHKTKKSKL